MVIQGSFLAGFTGGSPRASIAVYTMRTNAPSVDALAGESYQIGDSKGLLIGSAPVLVGAESNLGPKPDLNNDGDVHNDGMYFGITTSEGIGTPGTEVHVEWARQPVRTRQSLMFLKN